MPSSIKDAYERTVSILTREEPGEAQQAEAFVAWLEQYKVARDAWDAAYDQWEQDHPAGSDVDRWESTYYYTLRQTLIKDQSGDCYIVSTSAEAQMPDVD